MERRPRVAEAPEHHSVAVLQELQEEFTAILEKTKPEQWWMRIVRKLKTMERDLAKYPPEVQQHLTDLSQDVIEILSQEIDVDKDEKHPTKQAAERARHVIHDIAALLDSKREKHEVAKTEPLELSWYEIMADTDHFMMTERDGKFTIRMRADADGDWYDCVLPDDENMYYKGGMPRVVLKIMAGAPQSTIDVEIPPNDLDVVASGDQDKATKEAVALGVDLAGVEMVKEIDFGRMLLDRDTDLNGCFLGKNGLVYSERAWKAAVSGHIAITAEDRGIYGSEKFFHDGVEMVKNRGLQRLLKFVAEGKAQSFDITPLNKQVDLSIYWLVLARKFAAKKNAGELLNRLFFLAKEIGQVRENEKNIYETLDRVHNDYPFFHFDDKQLDDTGLAQWYTGKLTRFSERVFKEKNKLGSAPIFNRTPNDKEPEKISLKGYIPSDADNEDVVAEWQAFVERSRLRTNEQNRLMRETQNTRE